MSRVGKTAITIPAGVTVEFESGIVTVSGSKATLKQEIKSPIKVIVEGADVRLERGDDQAQSRALHGLYNRLIQNMITGVSKGFVKTLILNGVGYKANMNGADLTLNLGMSHPSNIKAQPGISFKVLTPQEIGALNLGKDGIGQVIQVSGASKEQVGAVASMIKDLRPVEPYHMYGIRYSDERVIRKASKSGGKGKKK
ncbi:MAG: 50S ribosomal protein L6 [Firmicutes bacterium]|nr:50S ribosomal protein L6 [Bacillota bacterium]